MSKLVFLVLISLFSVDRAWSQSSIQYDAAIREATERYRGDISSPSHSQPGALLRDEVVTVRQMEAGPVEKSPAEVPQKTSDAWENVPLSFPSISLDRPIRLFAVPEK